MRTVSRWGMVAPMAPIAVPPPLHTSEPGSFARDTIARRVPEILANTRRQLPPHPPQVAASLDALAHELRGGVIRGLQEPAPDRAFWDAAVRPHVGHGWLDIPWYFGEAFFYRRLLEATGYFGQEALGGVDPFSADKEAEWAPEEAPRRATEALAAAPQGAAPRLQALLYASLWGNRADLSYNVAQELGSFVGDSRTDVIVDHSTEVAAFLLAQPRSRVVVIADNAGTELLMDLALCDHLLASCRVERIELHVKTHPFFVSDAMPVDVDRGLRALEDAGTADLVDRLRERRTKGRFVVKTHPFYTTSLHYPELPADLHADLTGADLVILKGDANYRRLCSDAHWPPDTRFEQVVWYFPAPLVALRTLKAEVIVGLPPSLRAKLDAQDPRWMVNGRRGVVQARLERARFEAFC